MMKSKRIFFLVMMLAVLVFGFSSTAFATKEKSPVTCQEVGAVKVRCYHCSPNIRKYLGDAAVLARYQEDQGKKFCVHADDARSACASKYGVSTWEIGYYAEYKYRATSTQEEFYDTSCVKAVGY